MAVMVEPESQVAAVLVAVTEAVVEAQVQQADQSLSRQVPLLVRQTPLPEPVVLVAQEEELELLQPEGMAELEAQVRRARTELSA
jgi:hypothetical protein